MTHLSPRGLTGKTVFVTGGTRIWVAAVLVVLAVWLIGTLVRSLREDRRNARDSEK